MSVNHVYIHVSICIAIMSICTLTLFHYISSLDFYTPLAQINIEHKLVCLSLTAFQISRGRQFPHHVRLWERAAVSFFSEEDTFIPFIIYDIYACNKQSRASSFLAVYFGNHKVTFYYFIIRWLVGIIINQFLPIVKIRTRIRWLYTGTSSARRLRDVAPREKRLRFGYVKCLAANYWALTVKLMCVVFFPRPLCGAL